MARLVKRALVIPRVTLKSTNNPEVDSALDSLKHGSMDQVTNSEGTQGTIIYSVELGPSGAAGEERSIDHKLGTVPKTWWVCGLRAKNYDKTFTGCRIWQTKDADDRRITLKTNSNVVVIFDLRIM